MTTKAILGTSKALLFPISRNGEVVTPDDLVQLKVELLLTGKLKYTYLLNNPEDGLAIEWANDQFNVYLEASKTAALDVGIFEFKIWIVWADSRFDEDFVLAKKGMLLEWTK